MHVVHGDCGVWRLSKRIRTPCYIYIAHYKVICRNGNVSINVSTLPVYEKFDTLVLIMLRDVATGTRSPLTDPLLRKVCGSRDCVRDALLEDDALPGLALDLDGLWLLFLAAKIAPPCVDAKKPRVKSTIWNMMYWALTHRWGLWPLRIPRFILRGARVIDVIVSGKERNWNTQQDKRTTNRTGACRWDAGPTLSKAGAPIWGRVWVRFWGPHWPFSAKSTKP